MDIRYMVISDESGYDNYRLASISNMDLLKNSQRFLAVV